MQGVTISSPVGIRSMESGLRARPRDLREQYEAKLREAYAALGEAQLEIKALKKLQSLLDLDETS